MLVLASQHHSPKQNSFLETIKIDSTYKPDFCRSIRFKALISIYNRRFGS